VTAEPVILLEGLNQPEGPLSLTESEWLVTEMGIGSITRVDLRTGRRRTVAQTGRPNGLAVDADGVIWIAESRDASVMSLDRSASAVVPVTDSADGEPLLWPNDLCFGPDGLLYVTDSGIPIGDFVDGSAGSRYDLDLDGRVVVVDAETGASRILDRGLQFANGVAIGPNSEFLYVAETLTGLIHRYPLADIRRETRETFGSVMRAEPRSYGAVAGPDGMAFDSDGNLLVAVLTQGTLTVLAPGGSVAQHIDLPDSFPTNIAFGGSSMSTAVVTGTATGCLYGIDWPRPGLPLHPTSSTRSGA